MSLQVSLGMSLLGVAVVLDVLYCLRLKGVIGSGSQVTEGAIFCFAGRWV